MSLSFIKENYCMPEWWEGFIGTYIDYGHTNAYHRFIYDANKDEFVLCCLLETESVEGIGLYNFYFDAETGDWKRILAAPYNVWQLLDYYYMSWSTGSFGKVYSSDYMILLPNALLQMDIDTRLPIVQMTDVFSTWDPPPSGNESLTYCMERKEAIIAESFWISVYDCSDPYTPVLVRKCAKPGEILYFAYESNTIIWAITTDGLVGKLNFVSMTWEVITSLPSPDEDTFGYHVAYDTKRQQIVAFRIRADIEGKNNSSIEFYSPLYIPSQITDPVPVSKIVGGEKTQFIGHLIGTAGEGLVGYTITPSLAIGDKGNLITKVCTSGLNGSFFIEYECGNSLYSDTMQLSATVPDS